MTKYSSFPLGGGGALDFGDKLVSKFPTSDDLVVITVFHKQQVPVSVNKLCEHKSEYSPCGRIF